jgi:hypothetical protein
VLQVGSAMQRSMTHEDGGKKPVWQQTLVFGSVTPYDSELVVTLKNENTTSKDDVLGTARIPLSGVSGAVAGGGLEHHESRR